MDNFDAIQKQCVCSKEAIFECRCKNDIQYLCSDCISSHLQDLNLPHKLESIGININESSRAALIAFIKKNLNILDKTESSILTEIKKSILKIQEHANIVLEDFFILRQNLKSLLITLITSPKSTKEWNIKRILAQDSQDTINELSTWKLFLVSFNTELFEIPWVTYENNYEKYVTPKKLEPKPEQKSMIIPEPAIIPIERPKSYAIVKNDSLEDFEIVKELEKVKIEGKAEPDLFCKGNHRLVWSYTVLLEYFISRGVRKIQCSFCGKEFARPCWHCSECAVDVCEECGNKKGIKSPKLMCDNNHELSWNCTVTAKYPNHKGWVCNWCTDTFITPSWHCSQCRFNICKKCAGIFNVSPIELKDKCIFNHTLKQEMHNGQSICKNCSINITKLGYSCNICNYHICYNCNNFHNFEIPQDPVLSCQNKHLLRWSSLRNFTCNSCARNFKNHSFYCWACDFDLCYECADYIEDMNRRGFKRYDSNRHALEIGYLRNSSNTFCALNCKFCNIKLPRNCLVFACLQCNIFMCINCFKNDKRLAFEMINPFNTLVQLLRKN
ncbi:hypothetical protein SteCoe_9732 [Stentor coeruleus]|uniref:Uncharacterized protein n=1 Tax=Stentor coeruleus TaxID=5963 RepID=A0A1R2CH29_9CILI|nr:hypothetical protein SteCoe_9732 [Stentor coeruleus]